jgi:hypothetical protein
MLLLLFFWGFGVACNQEDKAVFARKGNSFPALFRSFGGLTVGKDAYVSRIQSEVGLSAACAECYGAAYMCGWVNCKYSCITAGISCDACLLQYKCISVCNKCTGFYYYFNSSYFLVI